MASSKMVAAELPYEILYRIITILYTTTLHDVCLSSDLDDPKWLFNITLILSLVCRTFQDVTTDIVRRALLIEDEPEPLISASLKKLQTLRTLGGQFRDPFDTHIHVFEASNSSPLLKAYSLYSTAAALRRSAAKLEAASVFFTAHDLARRALKTALDICDKVMPRGMEELLVLAVQRELEIAGIVIEFVTAHGDLQGALDKLCEVEKSESEQKICQIDVIKIQIHEAMTAMTFADEHASRFLEYSGKSMLAQEHPIQHFPKIVSTVQECSELRFDLDEYDISKRANTQLYKWKSMGAFGKGPYSPTINKNITPLYQP